MKSKETCSSCWELSNDVLHYICTHRGRVNSRLLVVRSQIVSLSFGPSFCHNLCYKCPNDSCEAIFDIYISIVFQWHEERLKARCFDPCNWTLKFRESRKTPKSPFRECECHLHTLPKVGLRHIPYHSKQTNNAIRLNTKNKIQTRKQIKLQCTYLKNYFSDG